MNRIARQIEGCNADRCGDRVTGRFASSALSASSQVNSSSVRLTAPTNGASGTISMPRRRVSQRGLLAIADSLSDRDWQVLKSVAAHRFLTVDQIRRFHFADLSPASSSRLAQKALQRLRRDRLLGTLDRRIGGVGFGSSSLVHYIDVVGHRLLQRDEPTIRRHVKEPTEVFLRHTLAIADTRLRLIEADRRNELELVVCELEPTCWRSYLGLGGTKVWVKPDLYIETTTQRGSDEVDSFFIEVDLGTESTPRLIKKCHTYRAYERTGLEQRDPETDDSEHEFPGVIWSLTHRNMATAERRRRALWEAITQDRALAPSLFHVISPEALIHLIQKGSDI